ncbi:cellulose biosynthesis protein BcsQ [Pseudoroseomonas cervicalis]|uniref:cellulose biosynthesis protein BcsQ n=1 Tax=Teichococcus cervicalis TaxID=204525 RepID=UPI0022F1A74D|nr:cellulose biosynthesis protein BcsQ [Pseudoroseomonas cervicalis]WBV42585.1 cellulose biosynthesis protein BcsQ [Pseudoroseomonas cervicalis]
MPLILFASPKGGVGKTTLVANVADALRRQGRTVLALDLDPQNALRLHFGLPLQDGAGYLAQLAMRPDWRVQQRMTPAGVALLPHGAIELRAALEQALALEREPALLAAPLRDMLADPRLLVLADLPPGPSQALAVAAPLASVIVTVLQSEAISAAMLAEVESGRFLGSGTMAAIVAGRLQFVLNGVDLQSRLSRAAAEAVARHLGPRLLGAVTRDEALAEALAQQRLVTEMAPASPAAEDLRQIARTLEALLPPPAETPSPHAAPSSGPPASGPAHSPYWGGR